MTAVLVIVVLTTGLREAANAVVLGLREAGPAVFFVAMTMLPAVGFPLMAFTLAAGPALGGRLGDRLVVGGGGRQSVAYLLAREPGRAPAREPAAAVL